MRLFSFLGVLLDLAAERFERRVDRLSPFRVEKAINVEALYLSR